MRIYHLMSNECQGSMKKVRRARGKASIQESKADGKSKH
jgi:hypothetical protein